MTRSLVLGFSFILLSSYSAFGAQAKVLKVSGNKAVIQVPAGTDLETGQKIEIGGEDGMESFEGSSTSSTKGSKRTFSFAATLEWYSNTSKYKTSTGVESDGDKVTRLFLDTVMSYNLGTFEFGPILLYQSTTTTPPAGASETNTTVNAIGAFGEYNIIANKPGTAFVPALHLRLYTGGTTTKTGTSEVKSTSSGFGLGGFAKIFALSDTTAIRAGLLYTYTSGKYTAGTLSVDQTNTQISFLAGLQQYF